jgi:hypothetical protein
VLHEDVADRLAALDRAAPRALDAAVRPLKRRSFADAAAGLDSAAREELESLWSAVLACRGSIEPIRAALIRRRAFLREWERDRAKFRRQSAELAELLEDYRAIMARVPVPPAPRTAVGRFLRRIGGI